LWTRCREGHFADTPHARLTLEDEDFDERWQWLETYAAWRTAMFVFIWPENLLSPTLRRWQTPAFHELVRELRDNRRLTPEQAREAAQRYADYFRDTCNLTPETAVEVSVADTTGDGVDYRHLLCIFARSQVPGREGTVYVSWCDPDHPTDIPGPWTAIPGLDDVAHVVGATLYQEQIYFFASVRGAAAQQLVCCICDPEMRAWSPSVQELDLPAEIEKGASFSAAVKLTSLDKPPELLLLMPGHGIYEGRVEVAECNVDNWVCLSLEPSQKPIAITKLLSMVRTGRVESGFCLIGEDSAGRLYYRFFGNIDDGRWRELSLVDEGGEASLAGAFCRRMPTTLHIFWRDVAFGRDRGGHNSLPLPTTRDTIELVNLSEFSDWLFEVTGYRLTSAMAEREFAFEWDGLDDFLEDLVGNDDGWRAIAEYMLRPLIESVYTSYTSPVRESKDLRGVLRTFLRSRAVRVYQRTDPSFTALAETDYETLIAPPARIAQECLICRLGGPEGGVFYTQFAADSDERVTELFRIAPRLPAENPLGKLMYYLQPPHTDSVLRSRRSVTELALQENDGVVAYLEEAWYAVPLYIASRLQRRSQFTAALDWFRTVYDYAQPDTGSRNIYTGLPLGEIPATDMARAEEWLLDPQNPHAIAMSRGATATQLAPPYTRFTLASLVQCLLEYADAEFTRDTSESLAHARLLYLAALDLLDLPELKQQAICDRVLKSKIDLDGIESDWKPLFVYQGYRIRSLGDMKTVEAVASEFETIVASSGPVAERYNQVELLIEKAIAKRPNPPTFDTQLDRRRNKEKDVLAAWLTEDELADRLVQIADRFAGDVGNGSIGSGPDRIGGIVTPMWSTTVVTDFCVPPNPIPRALRMHAELSLYKLRTCRNIAGMERHIEPYSAPTDSVSGLPSISAGGQIVLPVLSTPSPTPFRYEFLIAQAKHLIDRAAQMEAAFLAALEKRDDRILQPDEGKAGCGDGTFGRQAPGPPHPGGGTRRRVGRIAARTSEDSVGPLLKFAYRAIQRFGKKQSYTSWRCGCHVHIGVSSKFCWMVGSGLKTTGPRFRWAGPKYNGIALRTVGQL